MPKKAGRGMAPNPRAAGDLSLSCAKKLYLSFVEFDIMFVLMTASAIAASKQVVVLTEFVCFVQIHHGPHVHLIKVQFFIYLLIKPISVNDSSLMIEWE